MSLPVIPETEKTADSDKTIGPKESLVESMYTYFIAIMLNSYLMNILMS